MPASRRPWLPGAALLAAFGTLLWLEQRHPLRRPVEPKGRRVLRNLALAAITGAAVRLVERPLLRSLTEQVERRRWGLLQRLPLPDGARTALALLLLDYTLYGWHVLLHRVPLLWRCHLVHHADRDLDASTALRFHFAEFLASIPWRGLQVLAGGIPARTLALWQQLTSLSVLFHHSNLRLPLRVEKILSRLIATPRLHGIHHSTVRAEHDSNFSSGLALWDFLHGTARFDVPQERIVIGVPDCAEPGDVTLPKLLALPFRRGR